LRASPAGGRSTAGKGDGDPLGPEVCFTTAGVRTGDGESSEARLVHSGTGSLLAANEWRAAKALMRAGVDDWPPPARLATTLSGLRIYVQSSESSESSDGESDRRCVGTAHPASRPARLDQNERLAARLVSAAVATDLDPSFVWPV